ncbi:MAG: ABC transporter permease [Dehalococcoidia bacterium]|jgi:lipopolysaccharide transport system permease protein
MVEIWRYRELIRNLTVVELKNRYQNTGLGFLWSLLSPLLLALVLYFVFRYLYSQEPNFAAYLLVGLMSWRFFAISTTAAVYAVVGKGSLVTKVYIPRMILVLSNTLSNLISSLFELVIIIPILFSVSGSLPATILLFPLVFLIYFWFVYGASLFLAALYVYFRDVNQIWEVLVTILFFLSPIFYPMSTIKGAMPVYLLNPITEFIIINRNLMIYGQIPTLYSLSIVCIASIASFLIGSFIFNRLQRRFAEEM